MQDTDNSKRVLELTKDSGKLELDEKGYTKFIPSLEERKAIEAFLSDELERAIEDYGSLWQEAAENEKAYKAVKTTIDGGESFLPAPVCRIPADQIIARTVNSIMRPRPIFSFDPYFNAEYPVVTPPPKDPTTDQPLLRPDPMTGQMVPVPPVAVPTDAEVISRFLEAGTEFKVRERLDFADILLRCTRNAVVGAPYYIKICADQKYKTFNAPKINGAFVDLDDKSEKTVAKGEVVQWYLVPYFNAVMPVDEDDVDESPWFAERVPVTAASFRTKCKSEEFFLVDEEDIDKLAAQTSDTFTPHTAEVKTATEGKTPQKPRQIIETWLIWYRWIVRYKDEEGNKQVKELDLCSHFHRKGKRLLDSYINPYDDMSRGYVLVDQMEGGDSTVGILRYFQEVFTHILQAEIKNAFHANNFSYGYDPDSEVAATFEGNKKIRPGTNIPGLFDKDWNVARVGAEHYSLLPLGQFILGLGTQASNVSAYEQGDQIPGRTPAQTVAQILEQGAAQPILFLRRLNRAFTRAMRLYLERTRQFQPMGETLPIRDEAKKQIIEIPFRFPVGEVLDNFRIALTAADEAAAKEHEFEQQAMRLNLFQQYASFVAGIAGPISNPQATPAQIGFFAKTVEAAQKIFDRIIGQDRTDEEAFDLSAEVQKIVDERQMAMQMAMQPQIGANAQGQVPDAAGSLPPTGASDSSGLSGVGGQPDLAMGADASMGDGGEVQEGGF